MTGYVWKPIEDLPGNWHDLGRPDIQSLAQIWIEQAERLQETESFKAFHERLKRRWAIETGILEGLYDFDRGITEILIEQGIHASLIPHGSVNKPTEKVVPLLLDQEKVLEELFDFVANRRPLSCSYIKEVHAALTQHQDTVTCVDQFGESFETPLLRGDWKNLPNNPRRQDGLVHEYCPPEHCASEMDRLVELHLSHVDEGVPPEVESAWLHHRFIQIHPFQDGNGRVARTLASLVLLRARWLPLVIDRERRKEYISDLEAADHDDLKLLVDLFADIQKDSFLRASAVSSDVLGLRETRGTVLAAIGDRLQQREQRRLEERRSVFATSASLERKTQTMLDEMANDLRETLLQYSPDARVSVVRNDEESRHWFWSQVVEIAKEAGYFADLNSYHAWIRLKILEVRQAELVLSFHAVGREFLGVMAASAFLEYRDSQEDGDRRIDGPYSVATEVFQFNYREDCLDVEKRFEIWLNNVIVLGLDQWRRQL